MSILREVIESAEEVEWNKLNERLPILIKEVHLCRTEVFRVLDDCYLEFIQTPVKIPNFDDKLSQFQNELEVLSRICEEGMRREVHSPKKQKDFKTLLERVQNTLEIGILVKNCYHIHELFVDLQFHKNHCQKSLQIMKEIRDIIDNTKSEVLLRYYGKHFKLMESAIHYHFGEVLTRKIVTEVKEQHTISYINVRKNIEMGNSIQCLLEYFKYVKQLDDFVDFLWEFLILPIVTCGVTMLSSDSEIELKITRRKEPYFKDVFKRLHDLNKFLKGNLNIIINSAENMSLLDYIGIQLKDRMSSLLISHCLKNILKDYGDTEKLDYESIVLHVETLLVDLKETKLVTDDSLLKYAKDLEQVHLSRKQEIFFKHMKMIMTQKNYDIVRIGNPIANRSTKLPLDLPSMSISSVVQELHQLTEKILLEAKKNKLYTDAVFNILNFFRKYTSMNVDDLTPREVALLYNNYTYIAHELRSWNIYYSHIAQEDNSVPLFKDELYLYQIAGEDVIDHFLVNKRNKLEEQLNELIVGYEGITCEIFETTVRTCLRDIELLIECWLDLLSEDIFKKYIGVCYNTLCSSLIKFILKFECMNKDLIEKTMEIFESILKSVEKSYPDVTDSSKYISSWGQFKALSYVLQSDLVEIEINKYYELLKSNFKSVEVKKIFKTLFEKSEKRDAILKLIV